MKIDELQKKYSCYYELWLLLWCLQTLHTDIGVMVFNKLYMYLTINKMYTYLIEQTVHVFDYKQTVHVFD